MRKKLWITFAFILLLTGLAGYVNWPGVERLTIPSIIDRSTELRLGLDLQGGAYLVYQADTSGIDESQARDALNGVRDVFEGRINTLGVTEPELRTATFDGNPALVVSLPGITNLEEAKTLLGSTANLQFYTEEGQLVLEGKDLVANRTTAEPSQSATQQGLVANNNWEVRLTLTSEGRTKFAEATAANIGKRILIVLDGQVVSSPVVNAVIDQGVAQISGNFTADEARDLALKLRSGALPVPVSLIQEQTIGATLGNDAVALSTIAGAIAILLVMIFMIVYYKWLGVIASAALVVYMLLNVLIFRFVPITMTLAGIAAFIISIGVAVDTNILTFERLKEELRLGKALPLAIRDSFRRSWTSIRDSHVSGIISAVIIFIFASGSIRGFAVVLLIGTLMSLFTAITVTRNWMLLIAGSRFHKILKP